MWVTTCRIVTFVREHTSLVKGRGFLKVDLTGVVVKPKVLRSALTDHPMKRNSRV